MKRLKRIGALFSGVVVSASLVVPTAGAADLFAPKADYGKLVKEHIDNFTGTTKAYYEVEKRDFRWVYKDKEVCITPGDRDTCFMGTEKEQEWFTYKDETYENVPLCPIGETTGVAEVANVERENRENCNKSRDAIIKTASGDQWSPQMEEIAKLNKNNDSAVVLQAKRKELYEALEKQENYDATWIEKAKALAKVYPEANKLLENRSQKLVKQWQSQKWSVSMENALAPLATVDAGAERVLTEAQKTFLQEVKNSGEKWSEPLDQALETIAKSPSKIDRANVKNQLGVLRDSYVGDYKYWGWSEELERKLKPLTAKNVQSAAKLLKDKRNEYASPDLEQALTTDSDARLMAVGKYDAGIAKKHEQKRWAVLDKNKDAAWSRQLDDEVSGLAKVWEPAAEFMTGKRQAVIDAWRDKGWSQDMDKALAPLADVYQPAADLLQEKRDIFVTVAASKDFAEVEKDVNYLAEEKGFAPAAELAATKRAEKGDATDADPSNPSKPGKTEDTKPVDFTKVSEMTIEDARDLGLAERRHIVSEALKNDVPLTDFDSVARVYIGDVENHPLDAEAMETARKLADLGVPGAQKAYTIQAVSIAATVLASVAALVGVVNNYLPQIKQALAAAGIRV
ncbi:MAG: hypothetical protein SPK00_01650 [Corynebacterium glucuronolyticum]|nr:hypothetical protein [Mycobacteriaceae bacterium]MDY5833442.1 hypothetical protein [Corynebacterium glucuronolyticum]